MHPPRVLDGRYRLDEPVTDADRGPANEIQVVFESPTHVSEVKATCENGLPIPQIKESPR